MIPGVSTEYLMIVLVVLLLSMVAYMYMFVKKRPIKLFLWRDNGEASIYNVKDRIGSGIIAIVKGKRVLTTLKKSAQPQLLHFGGMKSWKVYHGCEGWPETVDIFKAIKRSKETDLENAATNLIHEEVEGGRLVVEGLNEESQRTSKRDLINILTGAGLMGSAIFFLFLVMGRIA